VGGGIKGLLVDSTSRAGLQHCEAFWAMHDVEVSPGEDLVIRVRESRHCGGCERLSLHREKDNCYGRASKSAPGIEQLHEGLLGVGLLQGLGGDRLGLRVGCLGGRRHCRGALLILPGGC